MISKPKQKRARKPKFAPTLTGLNLDAWRSDPERVQWAQKDPRFREIVTVLTNERHNSRIYNPETSEGERLGRTQGYELALEILHQMAQSPVPPPPTPEEPTYPVEISKDEVYD